MEPATWTQEREKWYYELWTSGKYRKGQKKTVTDHISTWFWGDDNWDRNSGFYILLEKRVKRRKRSLVWWRKNWKRVLYSEGNKTRKS